MMKLATQTFARRSAFCALMLAMLVMAQARAPAHAQADVLQQAINYVFTGRVDPKDVATRGPKLADREDCVVLIRDPRADRWIRYYLGRFNIGTARFSTIYSGRTPSYLLEVEGDENVVEFLNPDLSVAHGHRTEQIALPGDIERSRRALALIAERCKPKEAPAPF